MKWPPYRKFRSNTASPPAWRQSAPILGAILLDNAAYSEAAERLIADDFSLDSHRRIYARMGELIDANRAVDIITLSEELDRPLELESIGNRAYIFSLTENLPRRLSIEDYVRIVKDKSILRQMMGICSTAQARCADQSEDALEVLNATETALLEVSERGITQGFSSIPKSSKAPSARSTTSIKKAAKLPASPPTMSTSTA